MESQSILIVTQAIGHGLGGSEKALMEMIKAFDKKRYSITVLSLDPEPAEPFYNEDITIIYGYPDFIKMNQPFLVAWRSNNYTFKQKISKIQISLYSRYKKKDLSQKTWELYKEHIRKFPEEFDIAIGYGVGIATYFVLDKVKAKIKIGWLNTSLADAGFDLNYCRKYYEKMNAVITDSENGATRFKNLYSGFTKPVFTVRNLLDFDEIRMKGTGVAFDDDYKGHRILSVGRLCEAKAFHFAIEAAKILKEKGRDFRWYIVGFGPLENELRELIKNNELEKCFFLLGSQNNPYPFFKNCDIYVQTSVFEGSCITLEEAMAFYRPVVSTNFGAAYEKILDNKNGLIVDMNPESIALAVEKLLTSDELRMKFTAYQQNYPLSYAGEMDKLYKIIEKLQTKAPLVQS